MAFVEKQNIDYTSLKTLKREVVPVVVNVASGEVSISKVISVVPIVKIEQVMPSNKSAQIEGKLCAKVIIQTTEGAFKAIQADTLFKTMVLDDDIGLDSTILTDVGVVGIGGLSAGAQSVSLTVSVGIEPKVLVKSEIEYVSSLEVAECKMEEISFCNIIASNVQEFNIEVELEQPSLIGEILCAESKIQVLNVEAGNDIVRFSGDMIVNLVYLSSDEPAKLKNQFYTQSFSHEIIATNITPQDIVLGSLSVCNTDIKLEGELNSAKGTIILSSAVKSCVLVEKEQTALMVVDAFCPKYNLNLNSKQIEFLSKAESYTTVEKVDGSVVLGEESERIDRVLGVCGHSVIVDKVTNENDKAYIEGKVVCNVAFTLDDENCTVNSILTTIPFSVSLPNTGEVIDVEIVARDIDARHKRSKEIDIICELAIVLKSTKKFAFTFLCDATLGAKRENNFSPMCLYFVNSAENLWELSKKLCVSGELIMEQNPNLTFPITSTQKLLVYRKRTTTY